MKHENALTIRTTTEIPEPAPGEAIAACVFADEPRASHGQVEAAPGMVDLLLHDGEFKAERAFAH